MTLVESIRDKLALALSPAHLDILNESDRHAAPEGSERNLLVVIVAEAFTSLPLVERHRLVNGLLVHEFANGLHALSLTTLTPEEWRARGGAAPASPPCL